LSEARLSRFELDFIASIGLNEVDHFKRGPPCSGLCAGAGLDPPFEKET